MALATAMNNLGVKISPEELYAFAKKNFCDTETGVVVHTLLTKVCREHPVEILHMTTFTEQALFSLKYENAQVIGQTLGSADIFSNHKLHFTALVKAGSNDFLVIDPEFSAEKYKDKLVKVYPDRKLVVASYKVFSSDADGTPMYYIIKRKDNA